MTNFEVVDYVKFADGCGEITKIEERPHVGHLLGTALGNSRDRPHIENLESLVDRVAGRQAD